VTPRAGDSAEDAYAAALSGLPGMGPAALVAILTGWSPKEAWERVRSGKLSPSKTQRRSRPPSQEATQGAWPTLASWSQPSHRAPEWVGAAQRVDPHRYWEPMAARGIQVTWWGAPTYPATLVNDPQPPGILFWRGDITWLENRCVAIVGTRRATPDGRTVAFELGRDLAGAGVCVVSGLALGIDGAAHRGALSVDSDGTGRPAGPVGIAASGVDVPYPQSHAALWERVVKAGAVVSETPPGRPAQAWRFPSRNRVIAGLVRMVVVVESHAGGGSLITAEQAISRGIDVRVVPGPVHSPASAGSNQLLYDGPGPVRDARDVLDGLGIIVPSLSSLPMSGGRGRSDPELSSVLSAVLDVTGWRPSSVDQIVERSGLPVASVMSSLDVLEATGLAERHGDWWVRHRRG
jgi:DNA processing protein